jgi:outer membrane lipoprotein-sorting protein
MTAASLRFGQDLERSSSSRDSEVKGIASGQPHQGKIVHVFFKGRVYLVGVSSLRTMPLRRLLALIAGSVGIVGGGTAIALAGGDRPLPPPKALAVAIHDAATAPAVDGITARIRFTNHLIDSSSVQGSDPLLSGATGRLWASSDHRVRLELQSDSGDVQIVSDGTTLTVYDATMNAVYRADLPKKSGRADSNNGAPPTLATIESDLSKIAEHWNLSSAQPDSVAGRPAYSVRISPKRHGGLLGAAELAADASTGVPLRAAVFANGDSSPVLELEVTDISYGKVDGSVFDVRPPADAKVTDLTSRQQPAAGRDAAAKSVPFTVSAPATLAGMARSELRTVGPADHPAALVTYGTGLGGIAVLEQAADPGAQTPTKPQEGQAGVSLPTVSIRGIQGQELETALGTVVRFMRAGVTYTVAGSVPVAVAEAAARGL